MLRLLVALDFSDFSRSALHAALEIAKKISACELVVLTVLDPADDPQSEGAINETERAITGLHTMVRTELAAHHAQAIPKGTHIHYTAARGAPAEQIIAFASTHHVDAIVMGTHGRTGIDRLFSGSVAEMVVRQAPCSVLAVKVKKTA